MTEVELPTWSIRQANGAPFVHDPARGHRLPEGVVVADKYAVGEPIGRGAWSTVYGAEQQPIGREVALKVAGGEVTDPVLRGRFAREGRLLATIDHPNVVRVFELGLLTTGAPAIAMERLRGETLKQRIDREGPLPIPQAVDVAVRLLDALGQVHAQDIVHRDLRPANVFLVALRGEVIPKILDFGIGRNLGDPSRLTGAGQVLGTYAYLPPEQMLARPVDARGDLYTVGVLLFEALTGRLPFVAPGPKVVPLVLKTPAPAVRTVRPDVPVAVEAAIARALAKTPAERFATADAMIDALTAG